MRVLLKIDGELVAVEAYCVVNEGNTLVIDDTFRVTIPEDEDIADMLESLVRKGFIFLQDYTTTSCDD